MPASSSTASIEGACNTCYVADALQEAVGNRIAEAMYAETAMHSIKKIPFAMCFSDLPVDLIPQAEEFLRENGGCDFVRTGQCPLVGFLVDKVMEDY